MITYFSPKGQFFGPTVPMWLLQIKNVSLGAKMLYSLMSSITSPSHTYCWPSQGWLAKTMGTSLRSIQNYLRELVANGLIQVEKRIGAACRYYFIKTETVQIGYAKNTQGYATPADGYATPAPNIKNTKLNQNITPPTPQSHSDNHGTLSSCDRFGGGGFSAATKSADQAFAQLWAIWPCKQARAAAHKQWQKLWFSGSLPPFEQLMQHVKLLQQTDRWLTGRYVPHLVNWLAGARWEDQISASTAAPEEPGKKLTPEEKDAEMQRIRQQLRSHDKNHLKHDPLPAPAQSPPIDIAGFIKQLRCGKGVLEGLRI